jgi:hypothetical protein
MKRRGVGTGRAHWQRVIQSLDHYESAYETNPLLHGLQLPCQADVSISTFFLCVFAPLRESFLLNSSFAALREP